MSGQSKQAAAQAGLPEGSGPIDLAHLARATFGDRALRNEVLTLFLRQSAALAAEAADARDAARREAAAHKLKGAALGIGARAVAEAAGALERNSGEPAELAQALARLSAAVAAARAAAEDLLGRE